MPIGAVAGLLIPNLVGWNSRELFSRRRLRKPDPALDDEPGLFSEIVSASVPRSRLQGKRDG